MNSLVQKVYRSNYHSVYLIQFHIVFVTKYRRKVFRQKHLSFLKQIFQDVCIENQSELMEFNGEQDHVHLLISCSPVVQPSKLIAYIIELKLNVYARSDE